MKKTRLNRLISLVLVAMIMFPGSLRVTAAEAVTDSGDEEGTGTDENEEVSSLSDNTLEPVASGDATQIQKPRKESNGGKTVSIWDCIWFGNHWQEDTNGDGHCFERDTTVTKHEADDSHSVEYYTDQDGNIIYDDISEGTYAADKEQPIKWRVLDIDSDGNALLLADKLIDIVQYNEAWTDVTWETCTMRSYLNGYDASQNKCEKDFSESSGNRSFIHSAFNEAERKCLIKGEVKNPDNPVYETDGGNTTYDWLFCLSLDEAMNGDYGFVKNKFTRERYSDGKKSETDSDPTRVAVKTKFTDDKPGYHGNIAGTSSGWCWLRSPGVYSYSVSCVNYYGAVDANGDGVGNVYYCLRPAFRMNLSSSSSLWTYAGTVNSNGTVIEEDPNSGPDPSEEDLEKDIDVDTTDRDFDMLPGEIRKLPINKTGKHVYGVSYVSSDPKTVSVKNGIVTVKNLKKGETEKKVTVNATYNGESVPFVITVKASLPTITAGQKGNKITVPKTVKADVGTSKTVTATVNLPKALQGKAVKPDKTDYGFFTLEETAPDPKGTKASFKITPKEAGAAYIVWTVTDDSGNKSQAYTKVLIKKPLNKLFVSSAETGLDLSVGEGKRLLAATTIGNTDPKNLSFSVKGKGVKVSKSGFVTAITPGATADVTVKAGKYQKTVAVRVKDHTGSILALNKTSVNVKLPKQGAKPKTVALKVTMPKKDPPKVAWSVTDSLKGITVDSDGKVTVTSDASPGCYIVAATPEETGNGYNPVSCEVIVK